MGPEVLAVMAIASTVAGAGISAMGASASAEAGAAASNYQAQVARNNQIIAEQNAEYALKTGNIEAENQAMKNRAMIGEQKALQAASGLDVNSGSPLDVRASTAELGQLDTLTILNNAMRKAAGYRQQGDNFQAESDLYSMRSASEKSSGGYKVAASLVSAAGAVSDKWLGYKQKGIL